VAVAYEVRLARTEELSLLAEIERVAASQFRDVGLDQVAQMEPLSLDLLRAQQSEGRVWVVADRVGLLVGFAVAVIVDGTAHLEEVSVDPSHGRRGLGTRLVRTVCIWAREAGYPAVTLSTFRDVPWNALFYARLGFEVMGEQELGPELREVRAHEEADGFSIRDRVCMRKLLD
jgi:ribosomal protein S18 acetylase RimI-like enzyme